MGIRLVHVLFGFFVICVVDVIHASVFVMFVFVLLVLLIFLLERFLDHFFYLFLLVVGQRVR